MSKSVKKEILASEYSSEQVLAVNTSKYPETMIMRCQDVVRVADGRLHYVHMHNYE